MKRRVLSHVGRFILPVLLLIGFWATAEAQVPRLVSTASAGTVAPALASSAPRSSAARTNGGAGRASSPAATSVFSCADVTEIPTVECEALEALYNSTNGAGWGNNSGWLATNTPCSWHGVTCWAGTVTELSLGNNQLTGSLPPEIGNLTNLQALYLHSNQLTGTVPLEVAQLDVNAPFCDLTTNDASLCMPNTPDYQALGNLIRGLPLSDTHTSSTSPRTVTLRLNTATLPDTLDAMDEIQVRGGIDGVSPFTLPDGNIIDWNDNTTLKPANTGGDYWEIMFQIPENQELAFKFYSQLAEDDLVGGWEDGDDHRIAAGVGDTSLVLHFFEIRGDTPYDWRPYEEKEDSIAVWLRVYMNTESALAMGYNCENTGVEIGVRGDPLDGESMLDWGVNNVTLAPESDDDTKPGYHLFSGVMYYPMTAVGKEQEYKFIIGNEGWETISNRSFTIPGSDTTLHWSYFDDSTPTDCTSVFSCSDVTEIPTLECEALVAVYNNTNGTGWANNSEWLTTNTPCSWHGVTCGTGTVTQLNLYSNQLTGTIPNEIGNLSNLTWLQLSFNQLSGAIPGEIGNLSNLTGLQLYYTQLSGSIPPEIGNLTNLTDLYLHANQLSGAIPGEIGNLSNLTTLQLSGNQLTGTIPPEIGNLSNLTTLGLYDNQLTGTVPLEVAQVGANAPFCDLATNDASLCMPNTPDYQALGNPICGLPLSDTCSVLPVELASFEALSDGPNVLLKWATASETNNAGFEVQHRSGEDFRTLAFVEGAGTTTRPQHYTYRVPGLDPGPHTFRLKQVDFDGAFEYSPELEVSVGLPGKYRLTEAYPNPFTPRTRFTLAVAQRQRVRIAVYNTLGQRVATLHEGELAADKTHAFTFDAGALASGVYVLHVTGERFTATRTLTLLK